MGILDLTAGELIQCQRALAQMQKRIQLTLATQLGELQDDVFMLEMNEQLKDCIQARTKIESRLRVVGDGPQKTEDGK